MKRKWWMIAAVIVVIGAGVGFGLPALRQSGIVPALAAQTSGDQTEQDTVTVERGILRSTVSANGNLTAERTVSLAFSSAGRVDEVLVKKGDAVRAGDPLVRLETNELELSVAQAEASLSSAQAQLDELIAPPAAEDVAAAQASYQSAQAEYRRTAKPKSADEITVAETTLHKAEAALAQAQGAYDEVDHLPNIGLLQQSLDLQNATFDYQNALANYGISTLGASTEDLAIAQASIDNAKAQLDKVMAAPSAETVAIQVAAVKQAQISLDSARLKLDQATLVAPFDGAITSVDVGVGEMANGSVVELTDLSHINVDVQLNENDVAKIAIGQHATVTVDAFPEVTLTGEVSYIASTSLTQSGVVLYPVTIMLDSVQPGVALRDGMTASIDTVVAEEADVLKVPLAAIRTIEGQTYVLKATAGENTQASDAIAGQEGQSGTTGFVSVQVVVGATMGGEAEILSGLAEGDVVSVASLTTGAQSSSQSGMPTSPFGSAGGDQFPVQ